MNSSTTTSSSDAASPLDIAARLHHVQATLPPGVRLVAVSKYHPAESIRAAYDAGHRHFGESREQELRQKHALLPGDIEWHFIGHLQTNKVKYVVPYVSMIETVDSLRLLSEIQRQAAKVGRRVRVLLQLHLAQEATKHGMSPDDCRQLLADGQWRDMPNVQICGIMTVASLTDDQDQIGREFAQAAAFFAEAKAQYFADEPAFCECSWGMSHDYQLAIAHGATIVRIGTAIFGERDYK